MHPPSHYTDSCGTLSDFITAAQVLNNRMFSAEEPKAQPAERPAEGGEGAEPYYGFQLPEDEPGQVRLVTANWS